MKNPKDLVYVKNVGRGPVILNGQYLHPGETRQERRYQVTAAQHVHPNELVIQGEKEESAPVQVSQPVDPPAPSKPPKPPSGNKLPKTPKAPPAVEPRPADEPPQEPQSPAGESPTQDSDQEPKT